EMVVDRGPQDILARAEACVVADREYARWGVLDDAGYVLTTHIDTQIFATERPSRCEGVLDAAAGCPAGPIAASSRCEAGPVRERDTCRGMLVRRRKAPGDVK